MQKFKCHKVVKAAKILSVLALPSDATGAARLALQGEKTSVAVAAEWVAKHQPETGGYYVLYADGYASYSPARAFEDGYTPITELSDEQLTALTGEHILQFFAFAHLPAGLQFVSRPFAEQAARIMELPRNPERTVALRKQLESKDAAVRAALAKAEEPRP